jgi:hypothetical protein
MDLCQRTESDAVLNGSVAQIGARYLLTLRAVNCVGGNSLASTEGQARDKNAVEATSSVTEGQRSVPSCTKRRRPKPRLPRRAHSKASSIASLTDFRETEKASLWPWNVFNELTEGVTAENSG